MLSIRLSNFALLAAAWCLASDGAATTLYDVACPGVNSELQCPEGHVIDVLSIETGKSSNADCAARDQPAKISSKDCIQDLLLGWIKNVCNKIEHCRLPKPSPLMFTCNYTTDTFVQISYVCHKKDTNVLAVVECEGDTTELDCENKVLHIVKANFGRLDSQTCTNTLSKMTFCTSSKAEGNIKDMCENKQSCQITVSSEYLGEPHACDKHPKYLLVDYVCQ